MSRICRGSFQPWTVVTNPDLFYVRFHGRNARGWRSGNMQQQFDYDYTDDRAAAVGRGPDCPHGGPGPQRGVIFFNNHVRGQAVGNALRLVEILRSVGQ